MYILEIDVIVFSLVFQPSRIFPFRQKPKQINLSFSMRVALTQWCHHWIRRSLSQGDIPESRDRWNLSKHIGTKYQYTLHLFFYSSLGVSHDRNLNGPLLWPAMAIFVLFTISPSKKEVFVEKTSFPLSLVKSLFNWETLAEESYHIHSLKALEDIHLTLFSSNMDRWIKKYWINWFCFII